ncbi:MAG TPA: glycosyltransferase family 4 protein [Kiritimatiellia bacterium]|nr:glycosyltransferase family 4 protein [Kiritimatiellia bacterium]HMP00239.1 glycosyltransferase family 4 protein [Kiritimatiellia bacterium]
MHEQQHSASAEKPRILTNMAFWQSPAWMARVDSIYALDPKHGDPAFMPWWREVWALFRRRKAYDIIHTMGVRESFGFALLCRVRGETSRQIMTEVFIDAPQSDSLRWRIKTWFYRKLAEGIPGIITNSSGEIETNARRFAIPRERLRYVPLAPTIEQPEYLPKPDGHYFCGGRTLRDYTTLMAVMQQTDRPWQVVAGQDDMADQAVDTARIAVHREIPRECYLELLRGASVVVLPLLPTERATGQVVALEAMSYGKPVITTRAPGTVDIIRHGENGYLVEAGDVGGITSILNDLAQRPDEYARIGRNALDDMRRNGSADLHARQRLDAITALWSQFSRTVSA